MSGTIRFKKDPVGANPPAGYVKIGCDSTGNYIQDEFGVISYISYLAPVPVYGTELNIFESYQVSTSTSIVPTNKISSVTSNLPIGKYEINISFNYNGNNATSDFIGLFQFDGTNLGEGSTNEIVRREANEVGGVFGATGTNQKLAYSGKFYVDVLIPGIKSVILQYATSVNGNEASIWNASIKIMRVS